MLFYGIQGDPGLGQPVGFVGLGATDCSSYDNDNDCNSDPNCTMGASGCIPYSGGSSSNCGNYDNDSDCNAQSACVWNPSGSGSCRPYSGSFSTTGSPSSTGAPAPKGSQSQGSGTPWWATLTTALTQGAAAGLINKPKTTTQSFFTTPLGLGVIAAGIIGLVVLLRK